MRLLVVWGSPPLSSLTRSPNARIAPQPPGPGLPEQAPSVWMTTCVSLTFGCPRLNSCLDPIVAYAGDGLVETQLAEIFHRVLAPHQRRAAFVEPINQTCQQEPQRGPARQRRQRGTFWRRQGAHRPVGLQQAPALGHVVGVIRLEAPGIEADGEIIGERVGTGEVEVDQARQL